MADSSTEGLGQPVDRDGNPLRLMLVHAHPDDETTTTGATMARYAAEGVHVTLVTCTRGERGEIVDPDVSRQLTGRDDGQVDGDPVTAELLGVHRIRELDRACRALGVADVRFLGGPGTWWDSGMAADEPADADTFSGGDLTRQCRELVALIRELRPQVVISYDERGGYGHPDHIRAHDVTIAAVKAAVDPTSVTDGSLWHVPKLYATVIPQTALLDVARMLSASPVEGANPFAAAATVEVPDAASLPFGVPAEQITTKIDARAWAPAKIAAMRAHRSQMSQNGWFFALADATGDGLGIEHFQLLHGSPTGEGLEDDLFAGVRV